MFGPAEAAASAASSAAAERARKELAEVREELQHEKGLREVAESSRAQLTEQSRRQGEALKIANEQLETLKSQVDGELFLRSLVLVLCFLSYACSECSFCLLQDLTVNVSVFMKILSQ